MTDFTLGNDIIMKQEDNTERSNKPVFISTDIYSTSKISDNNNEMDYNKSSSTQDFNFSNLNNSILQITSGSPENKSKKENQIMETKNVPINTTNNNLNTNSNMYAIQKDLRFGNTYPLMFYKGEPIIIIGPSCILIIKLF